MPPYEWPHLYINVMAGFFSHRLFRKPLHTFRAYAVPAIHVDQFAMSPDVDARNKSGYDGPRFGVQ